jgi:hypothetical protein
VRAGTVPLDGVLAHLDRVTRALDEACDAPKPPATPDVAAVDRFVVAAYRNAWDAADESLRRS